MSIKVSDLKNQTAVPGPHPSLYCDCCGSQYSANKGDYFNHPEDYTFTCCGENMRLVKKITTFVDVVNSKDLDSMQHEEPEKF
jgi:hypothetical protein